MTAAAPSPWAAPNYSSLTGTDAIALQQTFQSLSNYLEKINNSVTINASASVSPTGTVVAFAGSTAPTGWLLCDGGSTGVLRTTYSALFAVIGTTYGAGDGSTTFNVPDLRGRVAAGRDNMGGTDAGRLSVSNTLGTTTGNETVFLSASQSGLRNHTHPTTVNNATVAAANHTHAGQGTLHAAVGATNSDASRIAYQAGGVYTNPSTYSVVGSSLVVNPNFNHNTPVYGSTGSTSANVVVSVSVNDNSVANASTATDLMQPTIILNYIIKA